MITPEDMATRILIGELHHDVEVLQRQLYDLREAALAFAYVAVYSESSLRDMATLEGLRQELNRCRPPNTTELKPGLRP